MTIGLILVTGMIIHFCSLLVSFRAPRCHLTLTLVSASMLLATAMGVLYTGNLWEWKSTFAIGGEYIHLRLDGVSAIFLALLSLVGGVGALYSWEYWSEREHPKTARLGRFVWNFLFLSMALLLLCSNGLHFLIAWELFALSAYFLITLDSQKSQVRQAGWLYLAASHVGSLLLFAFFALLAARTGSWDLGPMRQHHELAPLFWLALAGFGIKAGLFPLHIWLPSAHANAPSHVSALMSGVAIKMGIYGIVRFSGWLPTPVGAGWTVIALGAVSAILGVVFALGQHDLKRLLAYHSVENIGIILLGVGFAIEGASRDQALWGALALAGALLHVWNHGLFKSLLFLGAGAVLHTTGTRQMSQLGGLWKRMPWTAALFGLAAAAISGLPPLNGFISEWLVYLGMFDSLILPQSPVLIAIAGIILLAMTGALALACFVKVCGVVFLGAPRSALAQNARECGWWMRIPMLLLAAGCVFIGLAPFLFWRFLSTAIASWNGAWSTLSMPSCLPILGYAHITLALTGAIAIGLLFARVRRNGVKRAGTWDCGYAAPTARMQYTAGSFAEMITGWFGWILQMNRHELPPQGIFPKQAHLEEHTPETVLEKLITPISQVTLWMSGMIRRTQNGKTNAYLFYLVVGLAAVAFLTFIGSR